MARRGPALFELIRSARADAPAPPPTPSSAPPPEATPRTWATESRPSEGIDLSRRYSVSVSALFLAGAGVVVLCLAVWTVAFRIGEGRGNERALRALRPNILGDTALKDPLGSAPLPVNPDLIVSDDRPGTGSSPPAPAGVPGIADDTRVPGLNYFQIRVLDEATARKAAQFLVENGLPAFIVAVDRDSGAANNQPRFTLFASRVGITGDEYKSRAPARTDVESAVARLGARWKSEMKGDTDFSGGIWNKYTR